MGKVYFIAGLGADKRLFNNIRIPQDYQVIATDWLIPEAKDTMATYACKLIDHYQITDGAILVGVSLGGILSVEIAKRVKLAKVILISSIKTIGEAPWYFKFFRGIPVYKPIPAQLMTRVGFMVRPVFGRMAPDQLKLFKSMLGNTSPVFLKWAMHAVLYFDNTETIPNLYHIIGDRDRVFPYRNVSHPTAVIKGGTHIMVFNRADEINAILADILQVS